MDSLELTPKQRKAIVVLQLEEKKAKITTKSEEVQTGSRRIETSFTEEKDNEKYFLLRF